MIAFTTTLDRPTGEIAIRVRASIQPYGRAVGVDFLGSDPEIELLAVIDDDGKDVPTTSEENRQLRNLAYDQATEP